MIQACAASSASNKAAVAEQIQTLDLAPVSGRELCGGKLALGPAFMPGTEDAVFPIPFPCRRRRQGKGMEEVITSALQPGLNAGPSAPGREVKGSG